MISIEIKNPGENVQNIYMTIRKRYQGKLTLTEKELRELADLLAPYRRSRT